jgi:2'-5' RNA ligase
VDPWRERTCASKPSAGVPPHITLLFPFVPATEIDDALVAELEELVYAHEGFDVAFHETARFPGVLYLPPRPADPFRALTAELVARYPAFPPYEGAFAGDTPHLTVAQGDDDVLAAAAADIEPHLPLRTRIHEVMLMEEVEPDGQLWQARARLPLRQGW